MDSLNIENEGRNSLTSSIRGLLDAIDETRTVNDMRALMSPYLEGETCNQAILDNWNTYKAEQLRLGQEVQDSASNEGAKRPWYNKSPRRYLAKIWRKMRHAMK